MPLNQPLIVGTDAPPWFRRRCRFLHVSLIKACFVSLILGPKAALHQWKLEVWTHLTTEPVSTLLGRACAQRTQQCFCFGCADAIIVTCPFWRSRASNSGFQPFHDAMHSRYWKPTFHSFFFCAFYQHLILDLLLFSKWNQARLWRHWNEVLFFLHESCI